MKSRYISDLREGDTVVDVFLIATRQCANTRTGDPYLRFTLADKTGNITAIKWNASQSEIDLASAADYVEARGRVSDYQGQLQIKLDAINKPSGKVEPGDFLAVTTRDIDQMFAELQDILSNVTNPQLKLLLKAFFEDKRTCDMFKEAPAAVRVHHAYIGGLLEHTLNVVKSSDALAQLYPEVDRDILLTAAALHDIGKIQEYEWSTAFRFTEAGHFIGHVVGGAMMVKAAADRIEGFDSLLSLAVQHAILSHHGHKEFGSPKQPKSIEAMIVHVADELDADIAMYRNALEDSAAENDWSLFTKKHFFLDRPLFKGIPNNNGPAKADFESDLFAAETDSDPFA